MNKLLKINFKKNTNKNNIISNNIAGKILKFPKKNKKGKSQSKLEYAFDQVSTIMDNYKEKHNDDSFFLQVSSSVDLLCSIQDRFLTDYQSDLRIDLLENLEFVLNYIEKQERLSKFLLIKCK